MSRGRELALPLGTTFPDIAAVVGYVRAASFGRPFRDALAADP